MAKKAKTKKSAVKKKKSAVKKTAAKKTAARKARKARKAAAPIARGSAMPRREDVPGIARDLPDFANFRQAAIALRVAPFFTGPGAVPFSRMRATQILDPTKGNKSFNDFFLAS